MSQTSQTQSKNSDLRDRVNNSKEENWTKSTRKSQAQAMNPGGQEEGSGLHSLTKSQQIHQHFFWFGPPSRVNNTSET